MNREAKYQQQRVEADAKPLAHHVRDRSSIQRSRIKDVQELRPMMVQLARLTPRETIAWLQYEAEVWARAEAAYRSIAEAYPNATKMHNIARDHFVYIWGKVLGYREVMTLESSSPLQRKTAQYYAHVGESHANVFRVIAEGFPDHEGMKKISRQCEDCFKHRGSVLRPTLQLTLEDATAADAERAVIAYFDTIETLPFHMREHIADPSYPGQAELITLDLAGLLDVRSSLFTNLREALRRYGGNPYDTKRTELAAVVCEIFLSKEHFADFDALRKRAMALIRERAHVNQPVTTETEYDTGREKNVKIEKQWEIALSDFTANSEAEGGDGALATIDEVFFSLFEEHGVIESDFTRRELARIELRDRLERAGLTERQREIWLLHEYLEFTDTEVAELLGIAKDTVHTTIFKARHKLREAA